MVDLGVLALVVSGLGVSARATRAFPRSSPEESRTSSAIATSRSARGRGASRGRRRCIRSSRRSRWRSTGSRTISCCARGRGPRTRTGRLVTSHAVFLLWSYPMWNGFGSFPARESTADSITRRVGVPASVGESEGLVPSPEERHVRVVNSPNCAQSRLFIPPQKICTHRDYRNRRRPPHRDHRDQSDIAYIESRAQAVLVTK